MSNSTFSVIAAFSAVGLNKLSQILNSIVWTTKTMLAVCLLAAITTAVLGCTSTSGVSFGDAFIILFVIGPYLLLALLSWWFRQQLVFRIVLLAVAVPVAVWGVCLFGVDSYYYHTDPRYRLTQRMTVLLVPVTQWIATFLVAVAVAGVRLVHQRRGWAAVTESTSDQPSKASE